MLQHLLEERFSLTFHREIQQRPVYVVTVAKGGPKFKPGERNVTSVRSSAQLDLNGTGSI
jgi:uncharacterized protein (TIGR03435 family)